MIVNNLSNLKAKKSPQKTKKHLDKRFAVEYNVMWLAAANSKKQFKSRMEII